MRFSKLLFCSVKNHGGRDRFSALKRLRTTAMDSLYRYGTKTILLRPCPVRSLIVISTVTSGVINPFSPSSRGESRATGHRANGKTILLPVSPRYTMAVFHPAAYIFRPRVRPAAGLTANYCIMPRPRHDSIFIAPSCLHAAHYILLFSARCRRLTGRGPIELFEPFH